MRYYRVLLVTAVAMAIVSKKDFPAGHRGALPIRQANKDKIADDSAGALLLGFLLGPMMEEYLRRALLLARGDATTFLTRPLSAAMLALAVIAMVIVLLPAIRHTRDVAFREG